MNCEEAINFISARIDGEMPGGDNAALDAHLSECQACRMMMSELQVQDAALLRAFIPWQRTAVDLSDRVAQAIEDDASKAEGMPALIKRPTFVRRICWGLAAVIVGFAAGIVFVQPRDSAPMVLRPAVRIAPSQTAAHLVFATGSVFVCPPDQESWTELAAQGAIAVGAAVRTADTSKCELQMPDGSCMRLNSRTEARFKGDRVVQVSAGQLWSAVPRDAAALHVSAGKTNVTADGAGNEGGAQFELTSMADAATVSVLRGSADVGGKGASTSVHAGEIIREPSSSVAFACSAIPDPLLATQWQDDLITMKPADDPEVLARVEQLLARIASASDEPGEQCPSEIDVRARGEAWCSPIICYLGKQPRRGTPQIRRTAARLLADFAHPGNIPKLIELLDDPDGNVRYQSAVALRRLTGQTLGYSPDACVATNNSAVINAWRKWWEQNNSRYPQSRSDSPRRPG